MTPPGWSRAGVGDQGKGHEREEPHCPQARPTTAEGPDSGATTRRRPLALAEEAAITRAPVPWVLTMLLTDAAPAAPVQADSNATAPWEGKKRDRRLGWDRHQRGGY